MTLFWSWTLLTCLWSVTDRHVFDVRRFGHVRHWLTQAPVVAVLGLLAGLPGLMWACGFALAAACAFCALFTDVFSDDYQEMALVGICWGLALNGFATYLLDGRLW